MNDEASHNPHGSAFVELFLVSPRMAALVKAYLLGMALSFLLVA